MEKKRGKSICAIQGIVECPELACLEGIMEGPYLYCCNFVTI